MTSPTSGIYAPSGISLIFDASGPADLSASWVQGAVTFTTPDGDVRTGIARSSWFASARLAQLLYDDGESTHRPRRWHRSLDLELAPGISIESVEAIVALAFPAISADRRAISLIAHLRVEPEVSPDGLIRALHSIARVRRERELLCQRLEQALGERISFSRLHELNTSEDLRFTQHARRIFTVVLDSSLTGQSNADRHDVALRAREVATNHLPEHRKLGDQKSSEADDLLIDLSGDWSAMVLRDGAAFVMRPEGHVAEDKLFVSSIYTDALALARLQSRIVDELAIAGAERVVSERFTSSDIVGSIEVDAARFNSAYSATSTSLPERARILINAMHSQISYETALESFKNEKANLSSLARLTEAKRAARSASVLESVLSFLSIVGFPVSIGVSLWSVLSPSPIMLIPFVAGAVVLGAVSYAGLSLIARRLSRR